MQSGTPTHCRIQNLQVKLTTKPKLALLTFFALICEKCKKQTKSKSINSKKTPPLDLRLMFVINKSLANISLYSLQYNLNLAPPLSNPVENLCKMNIYLQ